MKALWCILISASLCLGLLNAQGNVGINTTSPQAMLHVKDSSVLFSAPFFLNMPELETPPPVSGPGSRMMWYPQKHAFRVGGVSDAQWNEENIGVFSFASGINVIAKGSFSAALGNETTAHGFASLAIGQYNDPVVAAQSVIFPTTPLFIVGNGDNAGSRSNALIVLKNGNVGIGTNNPVDKLHINALTGDALRVQLNSATRFRITSNGGATIGSSISPPANGLRIAGTMEPVGGIVSATNPIRIESTTDSIEIKAGASRIVVLSNGSIKILAAGGNDITIDAGTGDVILKGHKIEMSTTNNIDISAATDIDISAGNTTDVMGSIVRLNGGTTPVAKHLSTVSVTGPNGVVTGNVSPTVFTQ
jgi:hypothetical protein